MPMTMSAEFTPTHYKLTVEDYHKLGDAGILDEDSRVELIEGELIQMAPIGGPHLRTVNRLTKLFVLAVGDLAEVSVQNPVTLPPWSEPQPDFCILRHPASGKATTVPQPCEVLLLEEASDSTLAYDRGRKLRVCMPRPALRKCGSWTSMPKGWNAIGNRKKHTKHTRSFARPQNASIPPPCLRSRSIYLPYSLETTVRV